MLIAKEKVVVGTKHVKEELEGKEDYLKSLLDNKDYLKLLDEFQYYMGLQMIPDVRKFSIQVPISDKNLETLLTCLMGSGEYFNATKFLAIHKSQDSPL